MTMLYIVWPRAFVAHVGDSRCYLLRNAELEQITVDHTMSEIMVQTGKMSREEARHSPMSHALWNVLGGCSDELSVDVYKLTLEREDLLLLCNDGLYNMVPHEELRDLLRSDLSAESFCRRLVDIANGE
jgi:protein phosphatase